MGIWPYLCSNVTWSNDKCHPVTHAISWMSPPELSLPSAVSAWPAVFEEKEVWVTVGAQGQDCDSWNVACGNTFLDTSNLAERMSNLNQHLESIVSACPLTKFWSKAWAAKPWEPWARCWNQTGKGGVPQLIQVTRGWQAWFLAWDKFLQMIFHDFPRFTYPRRHVHAISMECLFGKPTVDPFFCRSYQIMK